MFLISLLPQVSNISRGEALICEHIDLRRICVRRVNFRALRGLALMSRQ